jgi:aminopeptidase-like protein/aminoglycoside N3'-acetyltransferase
MIPAWHYTKTELVEALRSSGIKNGDCVFVQVNLGRLGYPDRGRTMADACAVLDEALAEAVGPTGTVLVPTFTYSIGKKEVFEVETTPSAVGKFSEYFRNRPGVIRSADPMLAMAGKGAKALELLTNLPRNCFGSDSVYDRMYQCDAKICTVGMGLWRTTYIHHAEQHCQVPFRFLKPFNGVVREKNSERRETWLYSAAPGTPNCAPNPPAIEGVFRAAGRWRPMPVGRGSIWVIGCREHRDFAAQEFKKNPWFSAIGPPLSPHELIASEDRRIGSRRPVVDCDSNASPQKLVECLWHLRRDLVSDGYDAALETLAKQLPMTIHPYPTGTPCWTWIIPEKWTCHEAHLETLDGKRLFSYADNPLHVLSYSLPFEGEVTREQLLSHLQVHAKIPEAIPFKFKYYERDWGLCCSQQQREALTDARYRVVIKSAFSYGALKVGEVILPGASTDCIVLCAHLCHPYQMADDLSGVLVGLEVMKALAKLPRRRYSYRFLILPETVGSVAYLSHHEPLIPTFKGGLFLEMTSLPNPPALQLSFDGQTEVDRCFALAMKEYDPAGWTGNFRGVIGNCERQFNSPGVRVPMLSLSRVLPRHHPDWPFREYHSSVDDPAHLSWPHQQDTIKLVLRMLDTLEANCKPVNRFKGEVFCSRYGIHVDHYTNPEGHRALFEIMDRIDGTRSIADIAQECGISFSAVRPVIAELQRCGLVECA